MKNLIISLWLMFISFCFTGCAVVGDIFKAGVWVGVLVVVAVVALIIFIIAKATKN